MLYGDGLPIVAVVKKVYRFSAAKRLAKPHALIGEKDFMEIGICSYSFHRLLAAGKQDMFQYINDCKALGCTQLDPWNAHLADIKKGDEVLHAGSNPHASDHLSAEDDAYILKVKEAAEAAGLPFGCIAVDGAHIYDAKSESRAANRARAYRWLDVAHKLGAKQVRIDAGGPEEMPADVYAIIKEGFEDIIAYAKPLGVEIVTENHWGPTRLPENCLKLIHEIDGLGLLLDMHNFRADLRDAGRRQCAPFARAIHLKTFAWDENGNEITEDEKAEEALHILKDAGYNGVWGVESVPKDGDEIEGARKTIALMRRVVGA
jgi:sugar phosphate isomerase/epimerase